MSAKVYSRYRFYNRLGELLYVGSTGDLGQRIDGHRSQSPWYREVTWVGIDHFDTKAEARWFEINCIAQMKPKHNVNHNAAVNEHGAKRGAADYQAMRRSQAARIGAAS